MDLTHFTSDTLRSLLNLTAAKEKLLKSIEEVESDIAKLFKGSSSSVATTKGKSKRGRKPKAVTATATVKVTKPAKPEKKKRNISPEGRAKMAAMMKARWEARRAATSPVSTEAPAQPEHGQQ